MSRPLYRRERDPVPIVQEARWVPRPVLRGAENLSPNRDSISRPSSVSLYRLSYPCAYSFWQRCKVQNRMTNNSVKARTHSSRPWRTADNKPFVSALYRKRGTEACGLPWPVRASVLWTAPAIYSWGCPPLKRPIPTQMSARCSKQTCWRVYHVAE